MRPSRLYVVSFLWGLAEATFFFIVPDVVLSFVAIDKEKRVLAKALGAALAGALFGGGLMYLWGSRDPAAADAFLETVPLVTPEMIASARQGLGEHPLAAMVVAALTGVPYKIFAVQAASLSIPLGTFLLLSVPARLFRWLLVAAVARLLSLVLKRYWTRRTICLVCAAFWVLFYAFFFAAFAR